MLAVEDEALGVVVGCPPPLPAQDAYAQQLLEVGTLMRPRDPPFFFKIINLNGCWGWAAVT